MAKTLGTCVCCGEPGKFSIILAVGPNGSHAVNIDRYYIPNQIVRSAQEDEDGPPDVTEEVPFCAEHMRAVEDNLRATILYFQAENNRLTIKPRK